MNVHVPEIWNFYREKVFAIFAPVLISEIQFILRMFLPCVIDYIEPMVTFAIWVKTYDDITSPVAINFLVVTIIIGTRKYDATYEVIYGIIVRKSRASKAWK